MIRKNIITNGDLRLQKYKEAKLNKSTVLIFKRKKPKYPLIEKVVCFACSIAEANIDLERQLSHVLHRLADDKN